MKIEENIPHIVIVGAGFGGLEAARALRKSPAKVTVIDRNNYYLFQPLLYQVATAALSPGEIAEPVRGILHRQKNTDVLMGEVTAIDLPQRQVHLGDRKIGYDYLILAPGARYNYFGHGEWERIAPGLKTIPDALEIRRRILLAFETAEMEADLEKRKPHLNFVIVGGGPTGVELAGSIAELAHHALATDFRHMDPTSARIILVEAGPRILTAFSEQLSNRAEAALVRLRVEVRKSSPVEKITKDGAWIGKEFLPAKTVLWAAGVLASPLLRMLGGELDRLGRVSVGSDLSLPGNPKVFIVGDAARVVQEGRELPGIAPVAMQEGRYTAKVLRHRIQNKKPPPPFHYFDKGQLATVGRGFAIAERGKLKLAGFFGWLMWLFVHIFFLIGLQNRILVFIQWAWSYFTYERGARLIVEDSSSQPPTHSIPSS